METAIVSLICIGLIVFGGMTMSQGFLTSVDTTTVGMEVASSQNEHIMRTELSVVTASVDKDGNLSVTLLNSGQTKLSDFSKWDVIVQYYAEDGDYVEWLPYDEVDPGENVWTVGGIYVEGTPEGFEPDILNSGEEMMLQAVLNPVSVNGTAVQVVVSTPNGITASTSFISE